MFTKTILRIIGYLFTTTSAKPEPYFYEREKLPNYNNIALIKRGLKLKNKLRKENKN